MLSTDTKKKDIFVTYLKVAACLLITNSHCKNIYPHFFLAVGGGWGNALFFILSGYCLAHINTRFLVWYKKRLIRIVPPLLLTIFFNVLFIDGIWHTLSMECSTFFSYYINKYWFGFTILIFYIAFYFIFRIQNITRIAAILMIHIAIYLAIYCFLVDKSYFCIELEGFSPFKIYFYFGIFLVGGLLRLISPKIEAIFSTKVPPPEKHKVFVSYDTSYRKYSNLGEYLYSYHSFSQRICLTMPDTCQCPVIFRSLPFAGI